MDGFTFYGFFKDIALPPTDFLLLLIVGAVLVAAGRRRGGLVFIIAGLTVFYVLATPVFSNILLRAVQVPPTPETELLNSDAGAIVVLSAGYQHHAPEYGGETIDNLTLARLRYAAHLAHQLNLPILTSGGRAYDAAQSLAALMRTALEDDFGVHVRWVEEKSRDTFENATLSAAMLTADNIHSVLLVTHAAHMARAARMFRQTGLRVVPAPTVFAGPANKADYMPRLSALSDSYYALYEMAGGLWYRLRH